MRIYSFILIVSLINSSFTLRSKSLLGDANVNDSLNEVCECNNHSNQCTSLGACLRCKDNTYGNKCQYCLPGYLGDATRGTPFDCAKDPLACNSHGTTHIKQNMCICKKRVRGYNCDSCIENSFNLVENRNYKDGCMSCFCNGLNVNCKSSQLFYNKIYANFDVEGKDWIVRDRDCQIKEDVFVENNGIEFDLFDHYDKDLYFEAPAKFRGNKVLSYGGNISFTVKLILNEKPVDFNFIDYVDLFISGFNINIYHRVKERLFENIETKIVIPLYEDEFRRLGDDTEVKRHDMMMALSQIDEILIKTSKTPNKCAIRISKFYMDYASSRRKLFIQPALAVEQCECPLGYSGTSCETCTSGFRRNKRGNFMGSCEK